MTFLCVSYATCTPFICSMAKLNICTTLYTLQFIR